MTKHHKFRLCFAAAVAVLAVLVLILSQAQRTKATSSPPPGPHKAGDVWVADLGGRTTMAMAWCPPGKFLMGSPPVLEANRGPNEIPHEVTLTQGFWLGKYEVTQAQWSAIMGINPSGFPSRKVIRWKIWKWQVPVWRKDFLANRWQLPVERVNWNDCQEFCQKAGAGFRLPTEAEWEYACRAGSIARTGVLKDMGWFRDNSGNKTHQVGRKHPNAWGLYDMQGNVWEWCMDWYESYSTSAMTDPSGPVTGTDRILRGSSWDYGAISCHYRGLRVQPYERCDNLGFRVAFTPAVPPPANRKTPTPAEPL
jgi:formylglycine-generating enzyme required for sulfatase activity